MEACQGDCSKCVRYGLKQKRDQKAESKISARADRADWVCGICHVGLQERARPTHGRVCADRLR